jgi:hypothetical protein
MGQTDSYDGLNPMLKLNSSGQIISRRLYSRGLDGILADEAGGQTRWFLTDQVGTVRDLIANDGSVITHYVYASFGQLITQTNPSVAKTSSSPAVSSIQRRSWGTFEHGSTSRGWGGVCGGGSTAALCVFLRPWSAATGNR